MPSIVISFAVLTAIFLSIAALERVKGLQYVDKPVPRPWYRTDIGWYFVAAVSAGLSTFLLRPILVHLAIPGVSSVVGSLPTGWSLVVAVVVFDGVFFTVHRALHRSDRLWVVHKVHHSSRHLDVLATTRTHAFEHLVRNVPAQLTLFAFGFAPQTIAASVLVIGGFGALNHSNLRLPLHSLEWLLITPRLHRLHHVPDTTLNNYATVFSFWDRACGSLVRAETAPSTALGVPGEVDSYPQSFPMAFREPARQIRLDRRGASRLASKSDPVVDEQATARDQAA